MIFMGSLLEHTDSGFVSIPHGIPKFGSCNWATLDTKTDIFMIYLGNIKVFWNILEKPKFDLSSENPVL